ncbi:hypothetical protein OC846_004478 [Tilletia horrida]|uniref:Uncharacterized protein n=1 Tax=Tilletia horrida TaxID=155126 RepID=A0AAN6GQG0_9BASI|nr:hypothetical protein OC846_004478 [Tilletia horrida]KAK0561397.1 hypothetical protein OC861_005836 [Tilletia horrida]
MRTAILLCAVQIATLTAFPILAPESRELAPLPYLTPPHVLEVVSVASPLAPVAEAPSIKVAKVLGYFTIPPAVIAAGAGAWHLVQKKLSHAHDHSK